MSLFLAALYGWLFSGAAASGDKADATDNCVSLVLLFWVMLLSFLCVCVCVFMLFFCFWYLFWCFFFVFCVVFLDDFRQRSRSTSMRAPARETSRRGVGVSVWFRGAVEGWGA